ncbi:bifunctional (p)ppGpp synthetase/guanosine-3',5'-bis(diphosphate) 3'-pyrophosphohydrolase [Thiohalocapsa marina]|uniref:GTP pyrophosphokinase n=1 Tax=Thiohalocapsa marina TaxID=424902 RepID=A0A5M8FF82_9GAMM|nr:bifunctional (p)ppGpp synthetase/guanosine-3',5'-bis(diphosphate) 3'-pyrophosphohydrolase [Thiohalocapsa marina]KAA6182570.1 bifunctional (p)ppGpp synthetase/guanosine-3',5'-bis(diphosphate) 3'-pyrophosphohydrolase [Thiohalocapsa marina]
MVTTAYNLPDADTDDPAAAHHWLANIRQHYAEDECRLLDAACALMIACRGDYRLETGETEARHRLSTADILFGLRMDAETLCAALLNGCLGRDGVTEAQLGERFGPGIASMVADLGRIGQLTNVDRIIAEKDQREHEENLRRLLLGIAEDVRVVLVVLAERLHLMRSAKALPDARLRELAEDTQRVYAPLANRLGIWQVKWELEDLALRYLDPAEYKRIARLLRERRDERQDYIRRVITLLQGEFERIGVEASISGRPKHIYSIWRKMKRKGVDIDSIFDLRAVRIMVRDIPTCYMALGVVHGLWQHIPKEFDDYIATPKGNLYRSLHTAVIGPDDKPLEVQIRTFDMHQHAEYGVAAHWAYKESKGHDPEFQRRVVWMRNWLEQAGEGEPAGDIGRTPRTEFEPAHIYVLTPQAKVIELPRGATPLDFAYAIHSEIGNHCRGARVDGRIVPLNHPLASGETVEILTQKNETPSRDWLSPHHHYMVTARARNRVRQWFKQQDFDRYLAEGRVALDKELARLGIEGKPHLDRLAPRYNLHKGDDLLAAIGRGDVAAGHVARRLAEPRTERPAPDDEQALAPMPSRPAVRARSDRPGVIVEGVADLMTQMAACCRPVPHDRIVGYVTRGRGVIVHRHNCRNILNLPEAERERLLEVSWAAQPADAGYPVDIVIVAADRKGLLRDVSSVLADEDANVLGTNTHSDPSRDLASMRFTIEVMDADRLKRVLAKLKQLPDVLDVYRSS